MAELLDHQPPIEDAQHLPSDQTLRVLVVEDDVFTLKILKKRLDSASYDVATATNGREALSLVGGFNPHVILSDWMMPEMDGQELCAHVKGNEELRSIYFILLTARDKNEDKVEMLDTGADDYLVKPCDGRELIARIRAVERVLRLREELRRKNDMLEAANRRIADELQAISQIQRSLLPETLADVPGYHFVAHYQPSTECSGDFYDILPMADGSVGIAIGDVSGHGAPAMVAMTLAHTLLHQGLDVAGRQPDALLAYINAQLYKFLPTSQFVTMFYGVLEPATGRLTYSSAGHNPPMASLRGGEAQQFLEGCEGFPLKLVTPEADYNRHERVIEPGDAIIFYTDGLVEAFDPNGNMFGEEGFLEAVSSCSSSHPGDLLRVVLERVDAFRRAHPFEDDMSMLIVGRE